MSDESVIAAITLPEVLTLEQAATLLQLSKITVRKLAKTGKLPCARLGREWRFRRSELLKVLNGPSAA